MPERLKSAAERLTGAPVLLVVVTAAVVCGNGTDVSAVSSSASSSRPILTLVPPMSMPI